MVTSTVLTGSGSLVFRFYAEEMRLPGGGCTGQLLDNLTRLFCSAIRDAPDDFSQLAYAKTHSKFIRVLRFAYCT